MFGSHVVYFNKFYYFELLKMSVFKSIRDLKWVSYRFFILKHKNVVTSHLLLL